MTVRELVTVLGFKLNDAPLKKYDKEIDSTKAKSNALAGAAKGVGSAYKWAAAAVGIGIGFITKNIIDVTAETERYRVAIGAMMGDQEKANKIIHDLDYSPVSDFYGTAKAIGGLQNLVSFGMEAEEASETLTRIGDIALGNTETFSSLSGIMGKVFSKGKAEGIELKQFMLQGVDIIGIIAKETGKSREQIEKTGVSYEDTAKALKILTSEGGAYFKMLEKQSNTVGGVLKQFKSFSLATGEAIGNNVIEPLKNTLKVILEIARSFQDNIVSAGTAAFKRIITAIQDVIIFFQVLQMRMKKYGGAFTPLKALFEDVFGFLRSVISSAYPLLMNLAQLFLVAFKPIQAFVRPVLEALKPIVKNVFDFMSKIIEKIIPIVNGLTPLFGGLGRVIGGVIGPILGIAAAIRGINTAIAIGKGAVAGIKAIQTAYGLLTGTVSVMRAAADGNRLALLMLDVQILKSTIRTKAHAAATKVAAVASSAWDFAKQIPGIIASKAAIVGHTIATGAHTIATKAAQAMSGAWDFAKMIAGMVASKAAMVASTVATYAMAAATKVAAVATGFLNAAFVASPIGWIVLGIVAAVAALTAGIILLVKNWDKIGPAIKKAFSAIGNFFKGLWEGIKSIFSKIVEFVKKNLLNIVNVILTIIFPIAGIVMALVRLIIKHWDKIKAALVKVFTFVVEKLKAIWGKITGIVKNIIEKVKQIWNTIVSFITNIGDKIKSIWQAIWNKILEIVSSVIDGIKAGWTAFAGFITGLWEGITNIASSIWEGIKNIFFGVVDSVKNIWSSLIGFFTGLWDALKESPAAAIEYIKNAFFGLFENIKNFFFGFIDKIKQGWETVKGFFSGIGNGIVNFFTGGGEQETKPVNDLIVTPEGQYSTHPDDYVMAMKNPGDLIDSILRFLGGSQPQPAYAGAGSLVGNAMGRAANQNTYNSSSTVSNITAPINVRVDASGLTPDMASAVVKRGVEDALREAINGSRGSIPSPEARRH